MNGFKLFSGLVGATLLMCYDFFSEWSIWNLFPKWLLLVVGFALLMFSVYPPSDAKAKLKHFYVENTVMVYLVACILFLPNLGGNSTVGFSLNEPFLWIIVLLTVWQLSSYRKRILKEMRIN
ncbi:hypothetical protein ACWV26_10150 [Rummeliibacillus sp. JY-2-4R]